MAATRDPHIHTPHLDTSPKYNVRTPGLGSKGIAMLEAGDKFRYNGKIGT
jgi:hypothetical protein